MNFFLLFFAPWTQSDTPDNRYPLDVPALEAAYEKATAEVMPLTFISAVAL